MNSALKIIGSSLLYFTLVGVHFASASAIVVQLNSASSTIMDDAAGTIGTMDVFIGSPGASFQSFSIFQQRTQAAQFVTAKVHECNQIWTSTIDVQTNCPSIFASTSPAVSALVEM